VRAIVGPKFYDGDQMLIDDRLHVLLAISKDACFDALILKLFLRLSFLLLFCALLAKPASFVLCIFQRESTFTCAMVRGVRQVPM
jgi:hypothetical protein